MSAATENVFLKQLNKRPVETASDTSERAPAESNLFLKQLKGKKIQQPPEGILKGTARTAAQIPLGYAQRYTWPLNLLSLAGEGEALSGFEELQERIPELMEKFPQAPWEKFQGLDKEKYMKAVEAARDLFPTQQNVEKLIEEKTGLPLTPKTDLQKAGRLAGTAAGFRPGGIAEKGTAAVVAPSVTSALKGAGLPEGLAEFGGLAVSGAAPSPSVAKATKPSGMPVRRFESLQKETKVTPARAQAINEAVEKDFRKLAEPLLEENRTYSAMKNDTMFKEKISDLFGKVEEIAENIPEKIHTKDLQQAFRKRYSGRETKGITPDEFERAFRREIRAIHKQIPFEDLSAPQLVEQFRKNNKSLRELYEPGKSSAANRAKKEALLEYNRAIEDVITKKFPETDFKDLFEFTNKRWQEINDIEQIDKFMEDVFTDKLDYDKAKQLFRKDKEHVARPFKRILGEENFNKFKALTEDLLSSEKAMGHIKSAKNAGFDELAKMAQTYMISKTAGRLRTLSKAGKNLYNMLLDKPELIITWKSAIDNLKKGNYKESEKYFVQLASATAKDHQTNQEETRQ